MFKIKIHTLVFSSILLISHQVTAEIVSQWTGNAMDGLWTSAGNWSNGVPNGTSDIAIFSGTVNQTTSTIGGAPNMEVDIQLDTLNFNDATTSYTVYVGIEGMELYGAGIINNSNLPQYIDTTNGNLDLHNNSTTSNITILNGGGLYVGDTAGDSPSLGNATVYNTSYVYIGRTGGTGSAGNSLIITNGAATGIDFGYAGVGHADHCTIINNGSQQIYFGFTGNGIGYADYSTITNNYGGMVVFGATLGDVGHANSSTIINNAGSQVYFGYAQNEGGGGIGYLDSSNITNNTGGQLYIYSLSDGSQATLLNSGTLDLSGTYTTGTLSIGSLSGGQTGSILLGSNTLSEGSLNINDTYSGTITGLGNISKVGTGIWTLTGNSDYSGTTSISQGTLALSGNIQGTSSTTVSNGATLDLIGGSLSGNVSSTGSVNGYGTIGGSFSNSGIVHPVSSNNTINVNGNYTQNSNGTYQVNIQGSNNSLLNMTGTAALDGTLTLDLLQSPSIKTKYTVLQAAKGVAGTFSDINWGLTTQRFIQGIINYNPTSVSIVYNLNPTLMLGDAITPNQRAVANYLLNVNQTTNLPQSVVTMLEELTTSNPYQHALDQMSGATYANQVLEISRLAYASGFENQMSDHLSLFPYCSSDFNSIKTNRYEDCNSNRLVWATIDGGSNQLQSSEVSGLNTTNIGMTAGGELPIRDRSSIGGAFGFNHFNSNATGSEIANVTGDLFQVGGYGRHQLGRFLLGADIDFGTTYNAHDNRSITAANAIIAGYYHANLFSEELRATYNAYKNIVRPFLGLYNQNVYRSRFTEEGKTGFELNVTNNNYHSLRSLLGVLLEAPNTSPFKPFMAATYEHEFLQTYGEFNAQLAAVKDSEYFHVVGTPIGRDLADIKGGIMLAGNKHWSLYGLYEGQFANSWIDNSGRIQFTIKY